MRSRFLLAMWDVPRAPPVTLGPGNEQGFGGPVTAGPAPECTGWLLGALEGGLWKGFHVRFPIPIPTPR